jgi:hypothetical protein
VVNKIANFNIQKVWTSVPTVLLISRIETQNTRISASKMTPRRTDSRSRVNKISALNSGNSNLILFPDCPF